MHMKRLSRLLPLLLLLILWGCLKDAKLPEEIASVNDEPITLREAEARRSRLFSGLSAQALPEDDETLRAQYIYVVRQLVEETVICQYMEKKGLNLEPGELEAEEARIRNDYPAGAFEQMRLEEGLDVDLWRAGLRRSLLVRKYVNTVLRSEIQPAPEKIIEYYNSHADEFIVPEQWHFIQISGLDRKEVESARNAFLAAKNATDVQKRFMVAVNDVQAGADMLPEAFRKELAGLTPWGQAPVKPYEKEFRALVLLENIPQQQLDPTTATERVERILMEDALADAYAQSVSRLVSKAKVRVADALLYPSADSDAATQAAPEQTNATGDHVAPGQGNTTQPHVPNVGDNATEIDPE